MLQLLALAALEKRRCKTSRRIVWMPSITSPREDGLLLLFQLGRLLPLPRPLLPVYR